MSRFFEYPEEQGGRPYLIDGQTGRTFSYDEVVALVASVAALLTAKGVEPGNRVALFMKNGIEYVVVEFACLWLGAVSVPIHPGLSATEVAFIAEVTKPVVLACDPTTAPAIPAGLSSLARFSVGEPEPHAQSDFRLPVAVAVDPRLAAPHVSESAIATIQFTSGSTARPKGIAHRFDSLVASARAFNEAVGVDGATRMLHVMPMTYMAGFLNTLICPWLAGGSVVVGPAFDARSAFTFWNVAIAHDANSTWVSPTMLAALLRLDRDPRGAAYCRAHMRTICVGTAPLPRNVRDDFEARYGTRLLESYGITEVLFVSASSASAPRREGSAGRMLGGVECRVLDGDGAPGPAEQAGELELRTRSMFAGYLDPETGDVVASAADGWFLSGDLGRIDADGYVFLTGRKKDIIIRGGINVSPSAVEEALLAHPEVASAAVIGVPHDFLGEEITAVLVLSKPRTLDTLRADLLDHCRARLSAAQVPTRWLEVEALPVSTTGKVQKSEVRRMVAELHSAARPDAAPSGPRR